MLQLVLVPSLGLLIPTGSVALGAMVQHQLSNDTYVDDKAIYAIGVSSSGAHKRRSMFVPSLGLLAPTGSVALSALG